MGTWGKIKSLLLRVLSLNDSKTSKMRNAQKAEVQNDHISQCQRLIFRCYT